MSQTSNESNEQAQRLARALAALQKMRARLEEVERRATEPVAIVGMACRFPGGASSPEAYWDLLRAGTDAVTVVPESRWDKEGYHDPDPSAPGRISAGFGAFLEGIHGLDGKCFNVSPREAAAMDPQQKLLLEVSWEALESAGQSPELLAAGPTGLFVGMNTSDYLLNQLLAGAPEDLDFYLATGNTHSVATGRVSHILGLHGPNMAVDTACSASLTAVHLACQSLRTGECRAALAGGVNLVLAPEVSVTISQGRVFAADGRCKTFDAAADGYVRGEGCGIVVLKRLSDALADGDPILAVIRGSAVNHGGVTVPHGPSQEAVIRAALANASMEPSRIGYIEAHGTGTALGDPIEVRALAAALGPGRKGGAPLWLGSMKTNLGHLEAAAGVAGLMKVVLSLMHCELPPHLHFRRLNPLCEDPRLPLSIPTSLTPWPSPDGARRVAGVSSFGIGGTNAHVIVEEAPAPAAAARRSSPGSYLLPLSARSAESLKKLAEAYKGRLGGADPGSLSDICFTASVRRAHHDHRLAVSGGSAAEIAIGLGAFVAGAASPGVAHGRWVGARQPEVVFVFSAQGSPWIEKSRELFDTQKVFRASLERCDEAIKGQGGASVIAEILGASRTETAEALDPVLFSVQVALADLWRSWGARPDAALGRGTGEVAAAHVAGALSLAEAARIVSARGPLPAAGSLASRRGKVPVYSSVADAPIDATMLEMTPAVRRGERALDVMLTALGALYTKGHSIDWKGLYPEGGTVVALPPYAWAREEHARVSRRGGPNDVGRRATDGNPTLRPDSAGVGARPPGASAAGDTAKRRLMEELRTAPEAEREAVVLRHLRAQAARVLSLAEEHLDVNDPVARLGMSSLMVFDLKQWVKSATSISVPVETFSPTASVLELAKDLTARLREAGLLGESAEKAPAAAAERASAAAPEMATPSPAGQAPSEQAPSGQTVAGKATAEKLSNEQGSAWIVRHRSSDSARLRLICFPFAGAGASVFQPWPQGLPEEIDVLAVQPPGRDRRLTEPPIKQLSLLVRSIADALAPMLDRPFAFFGHSFGGLVSYEVARELRRREARAPEHLFVSASRAPSIPDLRPPSHRLPDEGFIEEVRKLGGMPEEILADRALLSVFLPALRADFQMLETYVHLRQEPLDCPITAFEGERDATVRGEQVDGWRLETRGAFAKHLFPGGHFFLMSERDSLLARIGAAL